jgi:hypothetical protein
MSAAQWLDLLKTVLPDTVLIAAVAWLSKAITTHRLSRDIERFRSDLVIEAHRDNTVFSRLHERRAEIIAELYAALVAAEAAVRQYLNPMGAPTPPAGQTLAEVALTAMWHLQGTAESKKIWFAPDTAAKVDAIVATLRQAWNMGASGQRYEYPKESTLKMIEAAWNTVFEKVPALRAALETEFRDRLAVELRPKRM